MAEALNRLDGFITELMDELQKLGIAENTLLIVMADNGPMVHNPPSLFGMADTIFRGGKGDITEGAWDSVYGNRKCQARNIRNWQDV
jgi:arylsulfatase A-like enzyme